MFDIILLACAILIIITVLSDRPEHAVAIIIMFVMLIMFTPIFDTIFTFNNSADDIIEVDTDITIDDYHTRTTIYNTNIIEINQSESWNVTIDYWKEIQRQRLEEW